MGIEWVKEYRIICEMYAKTGRSFDDLRYCYGGGYENHNRKLVIVDALQAGWLRKGKLWYCPHCRKKVEDTP